MQKKRKLQITLRNVSEEIWGNTVFWKMLVWIFIKEILFCIFGKSGGGKQHF